MAYQDIIGSSVDVTTGMTYGDADGFVIASGAESQQGVLNLGTTDGATVVGGGTVISATISSGGRMNVVSGAGMKLSAITLDGGTLYGSRYYDTTSQTECGKYTISGLTVKDGYMSTYLATASNYQQTGGAVNFWKGGISTGVVNGGTLDIQGGGVFFNNLDVSGGTVRISSGTGINDTVYDGYFALVGASTAKVTLNNFTVLGGTVNFAGNSKSEKAFTTVLSGATLSGGAITFSRKATLSGNVTVGGAAQVTVKTTAAITDTAASWNFDLTDTTANNTAFISDFSFSNATGYSVTVKTDQAVGTYQLAGNAANMDGQTFSFTVGTEAADSLIVNGPAITIGDFNYTLALSESVLTLSVEKATTGALLITPDSYSGKYDGQAHTVTGITVTGKLLDEGDVVTAVLSNNTITDAGTVTCSVASYQVMRGEEDVTSLYTITTDTSTLEVTKRSVTVTSRDGFKQYDGTELTSPNCSVTGDGFVDGEATVAATGTITDVGSTANTIAITCGAKYLESNYDVTTQEGTLNVYAEGACPDVIGRTVTISEGQTYANANGFVIGEGGTFYNGYVSGTTVADIYNAGTVIGGTITSGGFVSVTNIKANTLAFQNLVIDGGTLCNYRYPLGTGQSTSGFFISGLDFKDGYIPCVFSCVFVNMTQSAGTIIASNTFVSSSTLQGGVLTMKGTKNRFYNVIIDGGTANVTGGNTFNGVTVRNGLLNVTDSSVAVINGFVVSGGSAKLGGLGTTGANVYGGNVDLLFGTHTNMTVSGGTLTFGSGALTTGATLAGDFTIGGTALVKVLDGFPVNDTAANWIFDLTDRTGSESVMVEDFSKFTGTTIAISVATDQADGTYLIAGGASALADRTLSLDVGVTDPVDITVNGAAVETDFGTYTLALDEGNNLALSVVAKEVLPVLLYKDNELVASGTSFDGITIGGDQYDAVSILSGGTVTNLEYVSGAIAVQEGGILSGMNVSSGATVAIDYAVSDLTATATVISGVILASGAVVNGGTIRAASDVPSNGIWINDGAVANDVTVLTPLYSNACSVGGIANNLTISGGVRLNGTGVVNNATVQYGGILKLFNGTVTGNVDVWNGARLEFGYTTGKISAATVNFNSGATLYATHTSCSIGAHPLITSDSFVNVFAGARFVNRTELEVNGVINMKGGVLDNSIASSGHTGIFFGDDGQLNFDLAGIAAGSGTVYVANYDAIGDFNCTVNVDTMAYGDYILFGSASTFDRTVNLTVDGVAAISDFSLTKSYTTADGKRQYSLSKNASDQIVLTASCGTPESETKALEVSGGTAAGTWGAATSFTSGAVGAGNADATFNQLIIDNAGAAGAEDTWAFGGATGADTGDVEINLYGGTIGAIMGGAQSTANSVDAIDLKIGGGTAAASTGVIYGGGFGVVDGDTTITIGANATVSNQVYGGAMIKSYSDANVTCGDVSLDLKGGSVGSDVIGGARVKGDATYTTTVGDITINANGTAFSGGTGKCIYAGWAVGNGTARGEGYDYVAGNVTINVTENVAIGSQNGRGIFGGAFSSTFAKAQVGAVTINVSNSSHVQNVYGGGWAQGGAVSNVNGNVTIDIAYAYVNNVYGGGAHGASKTDIGTTNVTGDVTINVKGATAGTICAVGQAEGDTITGNATVNLLKGGNIDGVCGTGYNGFDGTTGTTTLNMTGFTGTISETLGGFDSITIDNATAMTFTGTEIDNTNWTLNLTGRTVAEAVLTWQNGSFESDVFTMNIGATAADWTVFDLKIQDDGAPTKADAFGNATFDLYLDSETKVTGYTLGDDINLGAWTGYKLDYDETTGKLAFGQLA